ncbi:O-antigen ligase like membrane protein [compost metagenome]
MSVNITKIKNNTFLIYASCLILLIEVAQGFYFKGDISKAGTNLASFFIISCLGYIILTDKNYRTQIFHNKKSIIFLAFALLMIFWVSYSAAKGEYKYDLFLFMRSICLGWLIFNFSAALKQEEKHKTLLRISLILWFAVSTSIILGSISGFGLYTYEEHKSGYKFFFPSVNELNFVYFSSFLILFYHPKPPIFKAFLLIFTAVTFFTIGNKSFIALAIIASLSILYLNLSTSSKYLYISIAILALLFSWQFNVFSIILEKLTDTTIYILTNLSSGSNKLIAKLSYLDPFSALTSERDKLFAIAWNVYSNNYGVGETLAGMGYSNYGIMYSNARASGDFSFSEIDIVDLFMSYGLIGIFSFFFLIRRIWKSPPSDRKLTSLKKTLIIVFTLSGILTGHIYFMGFPVFIFCCYVGLLTTPTKTRSPVPIRSASNSLQTAVITAK